MTIVDYGNGGATVSATYPTYATLPNACRSLSGFRGVGIGGGKVVACRCAMVKE